MTRDLIIAIGNVARGDDGVAHDVAARLLAADLGAETRIISAVGLDVAMAADVAEAARLIVVDAERRDSPAVEVRPIAPGTAAHSGHSIDAPGLLAVTAALYGAAPGALLVSVAAPEMGHGEGLSAVARAASAEAASTIVGLVREG
jgi:hydrogenase maturation protease